VKEEARSVLVQDCCAIKIRSDTSGKSAEDGIRQDFFNFSVCGAERIEQFIETQAFLRRMIRLHAPPPPPPRQ
jgi:hypothetical protein